MLADIYRVDFSKGQLLEIEPGNVSPLCRPLNRLRQLGGETVRRLSLVEEPESSSEENIRRAVMLWLAAEALRQEAITGQLDEDGKIEMIDLVLKKEAIVDGLSAADRMEVVRQAQIALGEDEATILTKIKGETF